MFDAWAQTAVRTPPHPKAEGLQPLVSWGEFQCTGTGGNKFVVPEANLSVEYDYI